MSNEINSGNFENTETEVRIPKKHGPAEAVGHNRGNFAIGYNAIEKWTSTRKGRVLFGHFVHPGIFSTVGFNADRRWFAFAVLIEFITILVSYAITGNNPIIAVIAIIVMGVDVAVAIFLHQPQQDINKLNCLLERAKYANDNGIIEIRNTDINDYIVRIRRTINRHENIKRALSVLLIIIAVFKILISIISLMSFNLALAYIVPALFILTAYIHIKHTGYYIAESKLFGGFRAAEKKSYDNFMDNIADNNNEYYLKVDREGGKKLEVDLYSVDENGKNVELTKIPDNLKKELDFKKDSLPNDQINKLRYNDRRIADITSNNIVVYGNKDDSQSARIVFQENTGSYLLTYWGILTDIELDKLIKKNPMSESLKSHIGYCGLKAQDFKEPKIIGHN